jgi:hypothetical protein
VKKLVIAVGEKSLHDALWWWFKEDDEIEVMFGPIDDGDMRDSLDFVGDDGFDR